MTIMEAGVAIMPDREREAVETAKIGAQVMRDARVVASLKDVTLTAYLTEVLRPIVKRDLARELARKTKEAEGE